MGIELKIKEIILEIEYLLVITLIAAGISDSIMGFFDKYYICLLFVIFHELSHILLGSLLNKKLLKVFIGLSGMTAFFKYDYMIKDKMYYIKEGLIFLAGPISNLIIANIFKDIKFIYEINIFLAFLNLLPIYPLDGYNILKTLLTAIFIHNKYVIYKIVKYISIIFLLLISIVCVLIFFIYKNVFCIIFLVYVLVININNK